MINIETVIKEVRDFLHIFGHVTTLKESDTHYTITFDLDMFGKGIPNRHYKAISMLCGGYLMECYDINGKENISLYKELCGLDPDNDKYSHLICEMNRVSDGNTNEIFINKGDRFERVVL